MSRLPWDEYFMGLAKLAAVRSTCPRASVGCVLVLDRQVIATGYNGSAPGMPHCDDEGCEMVASHCVRTIHAEVNAVGQAAKRGIATEGATAYVTHTPCIHCQEVLVSAGVKQVIAEERYGDTELFPRIRELKGLSITYLGGKDEH